MSKYFYAVNKQTNKRWVADKRYKQHYLVLYDSGALAEVVDSGYYGISVRPLSNKEWRVVYPRIDLFEKHSTEPVPAENTPHIQQIPCPMCNGSGKRDYPCDDDMYESSCNSCGGTTLVDKSKLLKMIGSGYIVGKALEETLPKYGISSKDIQGLIYSIKESFIYNKQAVLEILTKFQSTKYK